MYKFVHAPPVAFHTFSPWNVHDTYLPYLKLPFFPNLSHALYIIALIRPYNPEQPPKPNPRPQQRDPFQTQKIKGTHL